MTVPQLEQPILNPSKSKKKKKIGTDLRILIGGSGWNEEIE